jgi:hypothetical protein
MRAHPEDASCGHLREQHPVLGRDVFFDGHPIGGGQQDVVDAVRRGTGPDSLGCALT